MKEQDNRLFSSNSPIGRVWYFINLFLLGILTIANHILMKDYILPYVNPGYTAPSKFIMYLIYFILLITFFMLIDRRIYDISGERDSSSYNIISKIVSFVIFVLIAMGIICGFNSNALKVFYPFLMFFSGIFALILFVLGLIPGKITGIDDEEE